MTFQNVLFEAKFTLPKLIFDVFHLFELFSLLLSSAAALISFLVAWLSPLFVLLSPLVSWLSLVR
jgi:hypothetical protein